MVIFWRAMYSGAAQMLSLSEQGWRVYVRARWLRILGKGMDSCSSKMGDALDYMTKTVAG